MHFRLTRKTIWIGAITAAFGVAGATMIPDFYARLGIPDYDQRWDSLPNDGNMYCVPTAFFNAIEYMRTHGVPEMPDLTGVGTDGALLLLGSFFGTTPQGGTGYTTPHNYMVTWVGQSSNPLIFSYKYGSSFSWGTYRIRQAAASGSIVVLGYGRYERFSTNGLWRRNGGHAVTLKGYEFRNADDILFIRDPARDDGNNLVQGAFADFAPIVKNRTFVRDTTNLPITLAEYAVQNNALKLNAVDSMCQYMPATGGWTNNQFLSSGPNSLRTASEGNGNIVVKMPFQFTPDSGEETLPDTFEIEPREEVVDWVFDLGNLSVVYVTKLGRVFEVDLTDDARHHKLLHVVKGARQLMIGGTSMDIYVLGDGSVKPGDGSVLPGDGSVRFGDGSVRVVRIERDDNSTEQIVLPFKAVGMEYDPATGGPALLVDSLDRMVSLDENLQNRVDLLLDEMPAGAGAPIFRINPESGDVLYTREGLNGYRKAFRGAGRSVFIDLPGVSDIRSLVPVRANTVIVQDGFNLKTMDAAGNRSSSQFDEVTGVTGIFKMNRSHVAALPGFDQGPGWHNIPPDELDN